METQVYDAIIVGAGAAGLIAAWELVRTGKSTAIIEARPRPGGRIHTEHLDGFEIPLELGAEFIHGNLENTIRLLKKAGIQYHKLTGDFWMMKNGEMEEQNEFIEDYTLLKKKIHSLDHDISIGQFIRKYLSDERSGNLRSTLKSYAEGYYAGDLDKVSTFALWEEFTTSDEEQFRTESGYGTMIQYLMDQIQQGGGHFFFNRPVTAVNWQHNRVEMMASQEMWVARKALITVPIGILQAEQIRFSPALPEKIHAAKALGYGPAIKTIFQFTDRFWADKSLVPHHDLSKMSFIFSDALIPTWWTQYPKEVAMITGWSGGPHAIELKDFSDEVIMRKGLESLSSVFNIGTPLLEEKLKRWKVANWVNDPFSLGAYSYQVVNGARLINTVKQTLETTLFFAGEGLNNSPEIGTVEGALASGRETAYEMIASFD